MDSLTDTLIFKFKSDTLHIVRKEFNLHQDGALKEIINNFEDWISKQSHFKRKKFDRQYLELFIIYAKGSLEKAKNTLDKLCTLKTLLPEYFAKHNVMNDFNDISEYMLQATMPTLTEDNYRLYMIKVLSPDFTPAMFFDFQRFVILMSEYARCHDYSFGFSVVIDCRDINILNLVMKVNVLDLRNCMSVLTEGYGVRVKGIHLISSSKTIEALVAVLKQILSAKVGGRIQVHKTIDTIYDHVSKDVFPEEYGGKAQSLKQVHENWKQELSRKENVEFFREICEAGTDEKYRLTDKYNDTVLGMPGSFRTLTVD